MLFLIPGLRRGDLFPRCSGDSPGGATCTGDPKCGCVRTWGPASAVATNQSTQSPFGLQAWLRPSDLFSPMWTPGTWHLCCLWAHLILPWHLPWHPAPWQWPPMLQPSRSWYFPHLWWPPAPHSHRFLWASLLVLGHIRLAHTSGRKSSLKYPRGFSLLPLLKFLLKMPSFLW